jgi:hypothetical protein
LLAAGGAIAACAFQVATLRRERGGLQLLELTRVLVRFDHVARFIANPNHGVI